MTNGAWPGVAPIGTTLLWVRFTYPHLYTLMLTDADGNRRIRTTGPNSRERAFQLLQARTFQKAPGVRSTEDLLAGLLAVIHGDCGHHTHRVGFQQSTDDAISAVRGFHNGTPPLPLGDTQTRASAQTLQIQKVLRVFQERQANAEDLGKLTVRFPVGHSKES